MNILTVNKYFFQKGGAETYFLMLNAQLQQAGHTVIPFAMKHDRNLATPFDCYFTETIEYDEKNLLKDLCNAGRLIWSFEAKRKIGRLIRDTHPEIAHLHNFYHQLSPSILWEIKRAGIPIVYTAHDLKLLCPDYQMLCRGEVCEKCKGHRYGQCLMNRCMKDSLAKSAVSTVEMTLHHLLGSFRLIDIIISPSIFYRQKFLEYGYSPEKVVYVPNFIDTEQYRPGMEAATDAGPSSGADGYMAYIGRLVKEKGILTLLDAMKEVKRKELLIIGDGPLRPAIEERIAKQSLTNVRLLGYRSGKELNELLQGASFLILPSEWYENAPLSVLEAMACGKAVIGADIGGIPELVRHGENGLVFETGNVAQLAEQINRLASDPTSTYRMGREGRRLAETEFGRDQHMKRLYEIYKQV